MHFPLAAIELREVIDVFALLVSIVAVFTAVAASRRVDAAASIGNSLSAGGNSIAEKMNKISSDLNVISSKLNDITLGQGELQMRLGVDAAWAAMDEVSLETAKFKGARTNDSLKEDEKEVLKILEGIYNGKVEKMLNAYETCCASYQDTKVDPERFRRNFFSEIRNLVELKTGRIHESLGLPHNSKYKNIFAVYDKWHNPEHEPIKR